MLNDPGLKLGGVGRCWSSRFQAAKSSSSSSSEDAKAKPAAFAGTRGWQMLTGALPRLFLEVKSWGMGETDGFLMATVRWVRDETCRQRNIWCWFVNMDLPFLDNHSLPIMLWDDWRCCRNPTWRAHVTSNSSNTTVGVAWGWSDQRADFWLKHPISYT